MNPVLEVDDITRRYGDRVALDGVSLAVPAGRILGLLGPNGAGKTTTLECAEGLRRPDSGSVRFLGRPVRVGRVPARMGVQLQVSSLPGSMTVEEALRFVAAYRGARPRRDLAERLGLGGLGDTPYRQLSVGQQRRLQLALAVTDEPALVVLDEPTAGLDVATRAELHALLAELRDRGTSLVLATHDMAEAEKLSDEIAVLVRGRVVARGTPMELTCQGDRRTRVAVRSADGSVVRLSGLPGATAAPGADGYAVFLSEDLGASLRAVLDAVERSGDTLLDLRVERPTLEERFLEMTREERAA